MPYEDGAKTLFLYTKGTKGNPSEELKQLLQYMEHTQETYAVNGNLKKIQKLVDIVKKDEEVSLEYMKIFEREAMLIDQGKEMGIELGKKMERENTRKALQRAKAEDILELLQEYGSIPQWLEEKITAEESLPKLTEWLKASAKAGSIEEFIKKTNM